MRDTLLLNADGNPLSVAPLSTLTWQESIKLIWLDRINVLEWHDDWQTHIKPYKEPRQPDFYQLVSGVNPIHIDHEIWYKYINKPTEKKQKIA